MTIVLTRATKQAARYTAAGGAERCSLCRFFMPQGTCGRIIGPVSPRGWCKYYSREMAQRWQPGGISAPLGPPPPSFDLGFLGGAGTLPAGLTFTRAGTATDGLYTDAPGSSYNSFATNVPRLTPQGLLVEGAFKQWLLNNTAPATQSCTLSAAAYCLWVVGTGTATLTAGTATISVGGGGVASGGTPLLFTISAGGTVTVTVAGSLTRFQLTGFTAGGSVVTGPTSFIPTAGATAISAPDVVTQASSGWTAASSLVVDAMMPHAAATGIFGLVQLDDGTNNNRFALWLQAGTAGANARDTYTANTTDVSLSGSSGAVVGVPFKIGAAFAPGTAALVTNGVTQQISSQVANWPGAVLNRLLIGSQSTSTSANGFIRRIRGWQSLLSVPQLQQVTQ